MGMIDLWLEVRYHELGGRGRRSGRGVVDEVASPRERERGV